MTFQDFIQWVKSLHFYDSWNLHFEYNHTWDDKDSYTFLATREDKCHRFRRTSIDSLVFGIQDTLKRIEEENAHQNS
jgi:hypothetical protein